MRGGEDRSVRIDKEHGEDLSVAGPGSVLQFERLDLVLKNVRECQEAALTGQDLPQSLHRRTLIFNTKVCFEGFMLVLFGNHHELLVVDGLAEGKMALGDVVLVVVVYGRGHNGFVIRSLDVPRPTGVCRAFWGQVDVGQLVDHLKSVFGGFKLDGFFVDLRGQLGLFDVFARLGVDQDAMLPVPILEVVLVLPLVIFILEEAAFWLAGRGVYEAAGTWDIWDLVHEAGRVRPIVLPSPRNNDATMGGVSLERLLPQRYCGGRDALEHAIEGLVLGWMEVVDVTGDLRNSFTIRNLCWQPLIRAPLRFCAVSLV